jgi:hypothetical protein
MPTISDAKRAANQENAKKSTGPKSLEGKERSRGNAWKHGMTGEGIVTAEHLKQESQDRVDEWTRALRPATGPERWLVERAAVDSLRVDSAVACERARRAARLRDNRLHTHAEGVAEESVAETARTLLGTKEGRQAVVRELRSTSAGCAWLIQSWEKIARNHKIQGEWNSNDYRLAETLFGVSSWDGPMGRRHAMLAVDYITHHAEGWNESKPRDFSKPSRPCPFENLRIYMKTSEWTPEEFLSAEDLPKAPGACARAAERLRKFVADQIAELVARRDELIEAEALDAAEAAELLSVDLSRRGSLLNRYEHELCRRVQQSLREFHRLKDSRADQPIEPAQPAEPVEPAEPVQPVRSSRPSPAPVVAPPSSPISRNEPTASPVPTPPRDSGAPSNRPLPVPSPRVKPPLRE